MRLIPSSPCWATVQKHKGSGVLSGVAPKAHRARRRVQGRTLALPSFPGPPAALQNRLVRIRMS